MYVDGYLSGKYGETHKVSALETLQFSAISVIDDVRRCVRMDRKTPGDLIYVLGTTGNELGGSEYYALFDYVGLNVPRVLPDAFIKLYRAVQHAVTKGLVASVHGIYGGGLGVHLALVAMGGNLGMQVSLNPVPADNVKRDDTLLFSESAGRFIVTVDPASRTAFEKTFSGLACSCIGHVSAETDVVIEGLAGNLLVSTTVQDLKAAWKKPFGDLI
jgi:phosphoribosylformylglycinamidine synthase